MAHVCNKVTSTKCGKYTWEYIRIFCSVRQHFQWISLANWVTSITKREALQVTEGIIQCIPPDYCQLRVRYWQAAASIYVFKVFGNSGLHLYLQQNQNVNNNNCNNKIIKCLGAVDKGVQILHKIRTESSNCFAAYPASNPTGICQCLLLDEDGRIDYFKISSIEFQSLK
jgi:hypothetical protein